MNLIYLLLIILVILLAFIVAYIYRKSIPFVGGNDIDHFKIKNMYNGNLSTEIERMITNILYKYTKIKKPHKWLRSNNHKPDRKIYSDLSKINHTANNTSNRLDSTREKLRKGNYKLKHIKKLLPLYVRKYLDFGGSDGSNAAMIGYHLRLKKSDILVIDQEEWIGVKIKPREDVTFRDVEYLKKIKTNSLDLITCFHVLHHIPKLKDTIKELRRILKKGGTIIISEHDCYNAQFAKLLDVEHELFDIVINKSVTYDEFKKIYYGKYLPLAEWTKLFKKPDQLIELKNKDMTFYAKYTF